MIPYEKNLYQNFLSIGHVDKKVGKVLEICNEGTEWVRLLNCYF